MLKLFHSREGAKVDQNQKEMQPTTPVASMSLVSTLADHADGLTEASKLW